MGRYVAAIFGIGRIGEVHLRNMVQCTRMIIRYIVDVSDMERKAEALIGSLRLKGETSFINIEQADTVYSDSGVNLVVVCVPTTSHVDITVKALTSGKHVFCEKPLAPTLEDVVKCYDVARSQQKILMCAVNRRFDCQFKTIYEMKNSGKIGKIRVIKMKSRDIGNTEEYYKNNTGGIFFDMGIHDIDYICWMVGEKPSSVYANGCCNGTSADMYKRVGEYDTACAVFTFPSGVMAQLELSRECGYGYEQNVEVLGTRAVVQSNNLKQSEIQTTSAEGIKQSPVLDHFITRYADSFRVEMEHFIDAIEGKTECLVTPESYVISTKVAIALNESLQTGNVVKL